MPTKRRQEDIQSEESDDDIQEVFDDDADRGTPSKRARVDKDVDADEDVPMDEEGISDSELERMHEAAINDKMSQMAGKTGAVADLGIIQQVDLVNFLCHRNLTVKLIPQINFITGHNGSGKSAILTAIAVGLGGKATSTGRGTGLKSFIKEGESAAEVTIRMKNEGPDAIDPDVYGKSIIITRHFSITGASGFKIKSSLNPGKNGEGRVIATNKAELARITDSMNIQVDNPLNVLTQDLSRKFISGSSPGEKYEFFLKGTQLQQLSDDYQIILENIQRTDALLRQKAEAIPDLKAAHKAAIEKYKQATDLVNKQTEIDSLIRELAWAHVYEKQKELQRSLDNVHDKKRTVEKIEDKLSRSKEKLLKIEAEVAELEEQRNTSQAQKAPQEAALKAEKEAAVARKKELLAEKSDLKRDADKQAGQITRARQEIANLTTKIAAEELKIQQSTDGTRAALEADLVAHRAEKESANQAMQDLAIRINDMESELRTKDELLQAKKAEFDSKNNERGQHLNHKQQLEQRLGNKWNIYGKNIGDALKMIERATWRGGKPIGPLGDFVELKDRKWIIPVKISIGSLMSAWIVEHADDRQPLRDILVQRGNTNPNIIVSRRDPFDFSAGEPDPRVPTVRRVVEIRDGFVERTLVNVAHIESLCLANDRREAEDLLKNFRIQTRVLTIDLLSIRRYQDGGGSTEVLDEPRTHGALFVGSEAETRNLLSQTTANIDRLVMECEAINAEANELRRDIQMTNRTVGQIKNEKEQHRRRMNNIGSQLEALEERAKASAPAEVSVFQEAKETHESHLASYEANQASTQERLAEIAEETRALHEEIENLTERIRSLGETNSQIDATLAQMSLERAEVQHAVQGWQPRLQDAQTKLASTERECATLQDEFTEWTDKATDKFSPRIEKPRSSEKVQELRERLQREVSRAEKALGATADELSAEVVRSKEVLDNARKETTALRQLTKDLHTALKIRMSRWHEFRRHISIRAKILFQHHLANRGFFGKIIMQHPGEEDKDNNPIKYGSLSLKIRTDDQMASREKDTKGLSGGEKSFSTLCLLMSLWDAIGCPIRCLDEFDVFMDDVNRVVAMKMMIETARASESRQFVLITPLGTKGVDPSHAVRIIRMTDPERNQTTLPYQRG